MNRAYALLLTIALMVMVSACARAPAAPVLVTDVSGLHGIWEPIPPANLWREYRTDGTFRMAETQDGLEGPLVTGEYWFQQTILHFREVSGEPEWACGADDIGQYEVQMLEGGRIRYVVVEDECDGRAAMLPSGEYKKVQE
jgi:hypothetical protein